jgi:AhpD family alkylhydroperoxidase
MQPRIQLPKVAPDAYNALMTLSSYIETTDLDPIHRELIKIRASQINGCAFCINMHTAEARKIGMTERQIYLLNAWREADIYSDAEKAILAFTEEVTLIGNHVSDATYENLARHFDEKYISSILMMAIIINCWNRMVISTGVRVS